MVTLLPPAANSKGKLFIPKITGGKRGPSGPISTTSDEESGDSGKEESAQGKVGEQDEVRSVASPLTSPVSPAESLDYDNVSSPGNSSTASGPVYVRQPGFTHHAHEITKPRIKKKKTASALLNIREGLGCKGTDERLHIRVKPKKDPLPMRLRALPQSFWQQPNVPNYNVSPATLFPALPPLRITETDEDVTEVRPITPPDDGVKCKKTISRQTQCSERKITLANTDLLFKLFEGISEEKLARKPTNTHFKRGLRSRKPIESKVMKQGLMLGTDPHLVDDVSEKMFPQLSLEHGRQTSYNTGYSSLHLITVREGDKSVTLPSLSIEHNYPQMLSELVMHI